MLSFVYTRNISGDNYGYKVIYDAAAEKSLFSVYAHQYGTISAIEPIYSLFAKVFSSIGLEYEFFILVINVFFIIIICKFIEKTCDINRYGVIILSLFLAHDFYLLKLLSELHRLKIGVAFTLVAFLFAKDRNRNLLLMTAILSHLQIILLLPVLVKTKVLPFLFFVAFLVTVYWFNSEAINKKFEHYSSFHVNSALIVLTIFIGYLLFSLLMDLELHGWILWLGVITIFSAFLLGHERLLFILLEVIFYFIFYLGVKKNKRHNELIVVLSVYLLAAPINIWRCIAFYSGGMA